MEKLRASASKVSLGNNMFEITLPEIVSDIVLLLVRVVLVIVFGVGAREKFRDIRAFAKNDGLALPAAYFVAIAEAAAALGMLTGVLAQWAGVGLVLLMLSTMYLHIFKWRSPYWASKSGWEYDLLMLTLAAVVVVFGTGRFVLFG